MTKGYSLILDKSGNKFWYKDGLLHRNDDLPAIEWANGDRYHYENGLLHRYGNLPAIVSAVGYKVWYVNGQFVQISKY